MGRGAFRKGKVGDKFGGRSWKCKGVVGEYLEIRNYRGGVV